LNSLGKALAASGVLGLFLGMLGTALLYFPRDADYPMGVLGGVIAVTMEAMATAHYGGAFRREASA
jgi:drug/metabolite transporter (DMT)-like permease